MKIKLLGIGWKSKIILKRVTSYISINKLIITGCDLEKGKELNCYLAEDEKERNNSYYLLRWQKKYKQI